MKFYSNSLEFYWYNYFTDVCDPSYYGLPYENLELLTSDKVILRCYLIRPTKTKASGKTSEPEATVVRRTFRSLFPFFQSTLKSPLGGRWSCFTETQWITEIVYQGQRNWSIWDAPFWYFPTEGNYSNIYLRHLRCSRIVRAGTHILMGCLLRKVLL